MHTNVIKYHSTFSSLVVIKLFFNIPSFLDIICLKCQNLRKLQGKTKLRNWWKPRSQTIITNHASNNWQQFSTLWFGETLYLPIFAKRSSKKRCKRSHYVRSSEQCCQGSQIFLEPSLETKWKLVSWKELEPRMFSCI